ncbi:hypothetical protein VARIO8X_90474 [Burkholderiales bacterium 8X]|nr:hypothetical protein VARIO8X_90474 [Burkholderiales bacterium 8X]
MNTSTSAPSRTLWSIVADRAPHELLASAGLLVRAVCRDAALCCGLHRQGGRLRRQGQRTTARMEPRLERLAGPGQCRPGQRLRRPAVLHRRCDHRPPARRRARHDRSSRGLLSGLANGLSRVLPGRHRLGSKRGLGTGFPRQRRASFRGSMNANWLRGNPQGMFPMQGKGSLPKLVSNHNDANAADPSHAQPTKVQCARRIGRGFHRTSCSLGTGQA